MQRDKMKVLLYLKKSSLDKSGQAPIMGRITYHRTMAQFSCKLSCNPKLWNARESRLNGKSREAVVTNGKIERLDRKSTRLNSSHANISYAVFCLKKKKYIYK